MTGLPSRPNEKALAGILQRMAKAHLSLCPAKRGFTPFWRVRATTEAKGEIPQDKVDYHHARERWFALFPAQLAPYGFKKWPHGELIRIDLPDDCVEAFRVSAYQILPRHAQEDNPAAFSFDPENEFFLPASIAARAKHVCCVQTAFQNRHIPVIHRPSIHRAILDLGNPLPALV